MRPFDLIGHWFWALCILFCLFNYRRASGEARVRFAGDPMRAAAAERLLRLFATFNTLPWLVMGAGMLLGGVPGVWTYFRPQDGNPFVLAWLAAIFLTSLAFAVFVFAFDGAAKMVECGVTSMFGGSGQAPRSSRTIKLMAAFGPFFIVFWIWLVITMNAPVPH